MRLWQKTLAALVLVPTLIISGYVTYLWGSYIDETITSGAAYGFTIGNSKQEALASTSRLNKHPHAVVYISHDLKTGEYFTIPLAATHASQLQTHDQWDVLLDGEDMFSNSVRLTFRDDKLAEIYRHRQYFELP